ncbi:MAG: hypothetical protein M0013_03365 [Actinomycetota bacterium]|nr:hypothetical protein [Actinomycetota bacterium]
MTVLTGVPVEWDRPRALAELLVGAPESSVTAAGVAAARLELERSLPAHDPYGRSGITLRLDRRRFAALRNQPGASVDTPFTWSPLRCRRAIGLDALDRCVRGRATTASQAVADVLADAEARVRAPGAGHDIPWWARWWCRLPLGGRAVVQAEAVVWTVQLWTGIDWERIGGRAVVVTRDERVPIGAAPWCRLEGRVDLRVAATSGGVAHLVVAGGTAPADWAMNLGFPALVSALARGPAAGAALVLGWWPESGQVRQLRVDDAALAAMAGAVVSAAGSWWRHARLHPGPDPAVAVSHAEPRTAGR